METSWQLIWIVMAPGRQHKFYAPLPPLAAPAVHVYSYKVCGTINFNVRIYLSLYARCFL